MHEQTLYGRVPVRMHPLDNRALINACSAGTIHVNNRHKGYLAVYKKKKKKRTTP